MYSAYKNKLKKFLSKVEDRIFNFRTGCNFQNAKNINDHNNILSNNSNKKHKSIYEAVHCSSLRIICDKIFLLNSKIDSFFDIGCGKGKAIIYVGLNYSNKISHLYGIDINKNLVTIAKKNISKCNLQASISVADASKIKINTKNCIVFLFNPFDGKTLKKFIENNKREFKKNNIYLAYVNSTERSILMKANIKEIYNSGSDISIFHF